MALDIDKSIGFDNGGAFARHALIRDAHVLWQKNVVETKNGWLHRDLLRKRDINKMRDGERQDI